MNAAALSFSGRSTDLATKVGVLGLTAFAITLYALPQYLFPVLEPLRVGVSTAALAAGGLMGRWFLGGPTPTAGGWRSFGLIAFVGAAVASPLWSVDPDVSRWAGGEALKMALVYVCAASLLDRPSRLRTVAWAMALAGCVPAWYAMSNYLSGTDLLEGYRARWVGSFIDPNRLAMAVVASLLLLLGLRSRVQNPIGRTVLLALVGLQVAAVIVTYSRGALLGLGTGLLTLVLCAPGRRSRALIGVVVLAIGVVALAPERFWSRAETIATYEEDLSAQGRIDAWRTAGNIVSQHPLNGIGAAAFTSAWSRYAPGDAGPHPYVAHNLVLEVAAELGLPALFGLILLVGLCMRGSLVGSRRSSVMAESRGIFAALAGYLVCQMFAGFMLSFFLFLMLGMATACHLIARREARWRQRPVDARSLS